KLMSVGTTCSLSHARLRLSFFFFFFSSRRRHTRLQGDWSSDVCSSDLLAYRPAYVPRIASTSSYTAAVTRIAGTSHATTHRPRRSEERRVGKECRCRGGGDH